MQWLFITVPMLLFVWIFLCPQDALSLIVALKRQLRLHIIQQAGQEGVQELALHLHEWASQKGIKSELVDEVLEDHHSEIVHRKGTKQANDRLGKPTHFERYL